MKGLQLSLYVTTVTQASVTVTAQILPGQSKCQINVSGDQHRRQIVRILVTLNLALDILLLRVIQKDSEKQVNLVHNIITNV